MKELLGRQFFESDFAVFLNREQESFRSVMHRHDFIELSLVAEGDGYHYLGDSIVRVRKGDLFLIPIGTAHVFRPSSPDGKRKLIVTNCIFDRSVAEQIRDWLPSDSALYALLFSPRDAVAGEWLHLFDKRGEFQSLFARAYVEMSGRADGYRTMMTALLLQMLQTIHRMRGANERRSSGLRERREERIADVLHYIESHYSEKITIKDMAERCYMSVSRLQSEFKLATGQTFNSYLQSVRIRKCCQLLTTTDLTVQQSAYEVGYSDMKFFHSLFRRITGNSPQRFRRA